MVDFIRVPRHQPTAKYLIGSGKVEELHDLVRQSEVELVIFNHTLTPSQERNLERVLECRVLDRTGLILDIFAQRARTHEGKLQVELAQLEHMSTRLVRGWTHLERQKGGIGLRGPGETQLETDRRLLRVRIRQIKQRLEKVRGQREQARRGRRRADIPSVSLVGYTNAGKSTLFNALTEATCMPPISCSPRSIRPCAVSSWRTSVRWCSPTRWDSSATCRTSWSNRSARRSRNPATPTCCCTSSMRTSRSATSRSSRCSRFSGR